MKKIKLFSENYTPEDEVFIEKISVTYCQKADDCSNGGYQTLTVSNADAGAGTYFVLQTDRWALDKIKDLNDLMSDFNKRITI